ncbi:pitrilysin family protein [Sphingosinicella sp. BN140058]|uniref:M16 family metallopeptidase n=1 Tax=Sphingosinicella sp. BN140058 TaxID=1892855 RepID=UPI0010117329|nr:pitrilysin family protein [Sphingosinicella sp. BN140058]QAY77218.1 insulinase family protein [Sphingosinicella sp. BN140058]
MTKAGLLGMGMILAIAPAPAGARDTAARPAKAAQAIAVPPIAFKERRLANGLRVITIKDASTSNVAVSVWYEVGSKHDPEGRSGFAHLFEHILSRKTRNMPYNMINKLTEDVGGVRNASTWYDRTNYYEIVPARYLETMLWTHAERMALPVVDENVFETERNVVKEELRQRVLAPPYGRLRLLLNEQGWDRMPHRRPGIGSIEQLDAATLADARAFHEAFYGPDTATLIVSGNFDEAQLQRWVDTYFAAIPSRPNRIPLAITARDPMPSAPRKVTMYAPNVPLPVVGSLWRIPGSAHPDMPALAVLDMILTAGDSSRLNRSLVYDRQLATSIVGDLSDVEEQGYYAPYAILAGGKGVEEVETALAGEIARVREAPVTAAELAEAKTELLAAALRERETFSGRAFELGEALVRTGDPRAADARLAAVQKVTVADVQRVARTYLAPNAAVDFRYLSEAQRPAGAADAWANPVPMPAFGRVPAATRPPHSLADEGARQQPPVPSAAVPVTPPVIAQEKLPNGLSVVTARTGDVPIASMLLVVKGGASTDPRAKAGLASMAATLATRGTPTRTAQQIAAELESLGAEIGSGAGPDGAFLSISAPVANLEAAGRILFDVATHATFPEAELARERKRALDGLSIAVRDPGALASLVVTPLVYGSAPYGTIANGTPTSLQTLTRDDLVRHHRTWWHPGNAALIVSGGIDADRSTALAQALFGGWQGAGPAPQAPAARAGEARPVRTIIVDMPGSGQAAVIAALPSLARGAADYYPLTLANAVLGAGSNGRLFQEVRVKRALSYGAYSAMPARMDTSVLTASAQTKNESAADVAQIFLTELDRLGREPLDGDAAAKRIAFLTGNFNRQVETSGGLGGVLANLVQQGLPPEEAALYVSRMERVTPAAASAVAARIAAGQRASLVIVGDSAKFLGKIKAIRPDVEVIPLAELDLDSATLRKAR